VPEGDTVYRTARRLTDALGGSTLRRGELHHPRLSTVDLAGRVLHTVRPVGKHLVLRFDRDLSLHCHLKLDGSWRLVPTPGRLPINHRTRAVLADDTTAALGQALHDMALLRTAEEHRLVGHLGPDLLAEDWSDTHAAEAADRLAATPDRELAESLLDQTVMAGVGNVYKNELCFLLGVSPWTPVSEVDAAETVRLARDLLLRNALRANRNTTGNPRPGQSLWVYGRNRADCLRCGERVHLRSRGERVTYFCPRCQPGPVR